MPGRRPAAPERSTTALTRGGARSGKAREMQDRFVEAWHQLPGTLSKSQRAHKAAIAAGYSERTAYAAGVKLISKPQILEAILGSHPRTRAERAGIDAVWVLNELADLWDCPLEELFDERGHLRDIRDMPHLAQKLIAGFEIVEETREEDGVRNVRIRTGKIKLVDRLQILDKIGRNHLVSAYVSPATRDAEESLAQLMRAFTKHVPTQELDITPTPEGGSRRLADVLRESQDDGSSEDA